MRISDWSSDVCSSDLGSLRQKYRRHPCHSRESGNPERASADPTLDSRFHGNEKGEGTAVIAETRSAPQPVYRLGERDIELADVGREQGHADRGTVARSEEHTSELQSLMRSSYAVFCLKKQKQNRINIA